MTPARLNKKENQGHQTLERVDTWANAHASILLPLLMILLLVLIVCLLYAIIGFSSVESGTYYNHINNII